MGALTLETGLGSEFRSLGCWCQTTNDSYRGTCVFNQMFLENFTGPALYVVDRMMTMTRVRSRNIGYIL